MSIYWCLAGGKEKASSRLHGWLIHESFKKLGISSHLLFCMAHQGRTSLHPVEWWHLFSKLLRNSAQFGPQKGDVVILQKLQGVPFAPAIRVLRERGVLTLYVECDDRDELQKFSCDAIIVPSSYLRRKLQISSNTVQCELIEDPVEKFIQKTQWSKGEHYKIIWVGSKGHWSSLEKLQNILDEPEFRDLQFHTISDHPDATYDWNLNTVWKYWGKADVSVIPVGFSEADRCKSNNRVTQAMAMNTAVVCGEIPSYLKLIDNYENGILCFNEADWRTALRKLRDPFYRQRISSRGFTFAKQQYNISSVVNEWIKLINEYGGNLEPSNGSTNHSYIRSKVLRQYIRETSSRRLKLRATVDLLREMSGYYLWSAK